MAQVIIIEPNEMLRDLIEINLKTPDLIDVIPRSDANEAIDLLKILPGISLIILREQYKDENIYKQIRSFLNNESLSIPIICIGGDFMSSNVICVKDEKDWKSVVTHAKCLLKVDSQKIPYKNESPYVPVPIRYFYSIEDVCCDIFIRIKKEQRRYQYLKRIHAGESISKKQLDHYFKQGLLNFYILREEQERFANYLTNELIKKLERKDNSTKGEIDLLHEAYHILASEIKRFGFSPAIVSLSEHVIERMKSTLKRTPELSVFFHQILNSDTSYYYQHAHISLVMSLELLKALKISNEQSIQKLAYGAFFKDVILAMHGVSEKFARIGSYEELENYVLDDAEKTIILEHALDGAILIRMHPQCPIGLDQIIKNHHGSNQGKGFSAMPEGLPIESKVMVLACEFAKEMLDYIGTEKAPRPVIQTLMRKYEDQEYHRVIKALDYTLRRGSSIVSKR